MRTVLVATDLTARGKFALQRACLIAEEQCAKLTLVHVAPRSLSPAKRARLTEELSAIGDAHSARHPCIQSIIPLLAFGRPADAIAAQATKIAADLIVVGGHGAVRWTDELIGTAVERLIRRVAMPVLVVHRPRVSLIAASSPRSTRVSSPSRHSTSATIASVATVYSVHAFLPTLHDLVIARGDEAALAATQQQAFERTMRSVLGDRRDIGFKVHAITRRSDPVSVIVDAWESLGADLVVTVTHGRSGLALALRGSFADMLIEDAPFDLLMRHRS